MATVMVDGHGAICEVDAEAQDLFGYSAAELQGQSVRRLVAEPYFSRYEDCIRRHRAERGAARLAFSGRAQIRKASGESAAAWISVEERVLGEQRCYVGHFEAQEIPSGSEDRLLQTELAEAQQTSLLSAIIAGLAHEMSQPLSAATNYTWAAQRMLQLECPDLPLIAESCGRAAEQLRRAGTTLTELRERCRARVNRDRSIDPNRLISCLTEIMAADMRAYDVELTVAYGVELPGCHGDFEGLLVVLMNLTRNAIEAMADTEWLDRHLNIESRAVLPDQVEIALQDHGPGIPADLGLEIFQPFVSGRANRMGLGLAASQALLRMRQGSLRYEPRLGGGTTFIMSLPSTTGMGAPRGPIG